MNVDIPSGWGSVARQISTSSALNPSLFLCAICVPTGLALATWGSGALSAFGCLVAAAPISVTLWQIGRFTIRDPDRLQHDRHIEAKMIISQRIGMNSNGETTEIEIPRSGVLIDNPDRHEEISA